MPYPMSFKAVLARKAEKKARRAQKLADDTSLRAAVAEDSPGAGDGGLKQPNSLKTQNRLKRNSERNGAKRRINRKSEIKRLKKSGLILWSLAVRSRDGNRCLMCGRTSNLNAHHWLFRKSHSVRLALDPANGATLCAYPCHLGRIHHDGDGDFMLKLADKMFEIVGKEKVEEMRRTAKVSGSVSLEEIQAAVENLKKQGAV